MVFVRLRYRDMRDMRQADMHAIDALCDLPCHPYRGRVNAGAPYKEQLLQILLTAEISSSVPMDATVTRQARIGRG
jgi:hypothetical protein